MATTREGLSERMGEDDARQLLARAAEIDAARGMTLTIEQLREAARESGIPLDAFDAALAERAGRTIGPGPAMPEPMPRGRMDAARVWWRRDLLPIVTRNGAAIVVGWAALTVSHNVVRTMSGSWLAHKAADPVAMLLTAAAAASLGARRLAIIAGGFAISQGAEFLLDVALGAPAVHGRNPHLALMALGLVMAWLVDRRLRRPPSRAPETTESAAPSRTSAQSLLTRLRRSITDRRWYTRQTFPTPRVAVSAA